MRNPGKWAVYSKIIMSGKNLVFRVSRGSEVFVANQNSAIKRCNTTPEQGRCENVWLVVFWLLCGII